MNKKDNYATARPYYPFFDSTADKKPPKDEELKKLNGVNGVNGDLNGNVEHFTATSETTMTLKNVMKQNLERKKMFDKKKRKLNIIQQWAVHSMKRYPDVFQHYMKMSGALHNETTLEYQALHQEEDVTFTPTLPVLKTKRTKENKNKISSRTKNKKIKKNRLVRNEDGLITQEITDDDDNGSQNSTVIDATAESIRQAYSLVESKFLVNRKMADKKLSSLETQLKNMRVQHDYRKKKRKGNLRKNVRV